MTDRLPRHDCYMLGDARIKEKEMEKKYKILGFADWNWALLEKEIPCYTNRDWSHWSNK